MIMRAFINLFLKIIIVIDLEFWRTIR